MGPKSATLGKTQTMLSRGQPNFWSSSTTFGLILAELERASTNNSGFSPNLSRVQPTLAEFDQHWPKLTTCLPVSPQFGPCSSKLRPYSKKKTGLPPNCADFGQIVDADQLWGNMGPTSAKLGLKSPSWVGVRPESGRILDRTRLEFGQLRTSKQCRAL